MASDTGNLQQQPPVDAAAGPTETTPTPKKRKGAHERDGLYYDERRGTWYWRKTNKKSGKRVHKNTGQKVRRLAQRVAKEFEDELAAEEAGVRTFDAYKGELTPLVDEWVAALENGDEPPQPATLRQKKRETLRALDELGLRRAGDLTHVTRVDDRLRALIRQGLPRLKARRCYYEPLRQFARWLSENGRYLPADPLATWRPIKVPRDERRARRRAFLPADVARALAALDALDKKLGRAGCSRVTFEALLVTAPRASALVDRNVVHFDPKMPKINYGLGKGNKVRGSGCLDPTTAEKIKATTSGRGPYEPLFLSPQGERWQVDRLLDVWRQAWSLGVVADLWPADEAQDVDVAILVSRALLTGHVRVSRGGNPNVVTADTVRARLDLELRVAGIVEGMRAEWVERTKGVDVHSARCTLQTWAEASGVPRPAIDRQLGHDGHGSNETNDVMRAILGSRTGRKHYLDAGSALFDARQAAEAVRTLLNEAEAQLRADGSMLLAATESRAAQA
jgi:hypothetical protein